MNTWQKTVTEFVAKHDNSEDITNADIEVFIEEGLYPLLEEYQDLKIAADALVDNNLEIFKQVITNPNHKMKNSKFYKALNSVMKLTKEQKGLM